MTTQQGYLLYLVSLFKDTSSNFIINYFKKYRNSFTESIIISSTIYMIISKYFLKTDFCNKKCEHFSESSKNSKNQYQTGLCVFCESTSSQRSNSRSSSNSPSSFYDHDFCNDNLESSSKSKSSYASESSNSNLKANSPIAVQQITKASSRLNTRSNPRSKFISSSNSSSNIDSRIKYQTSMVKHKSYPIIYKTFAFMSVSSNYTENPNIQRKITIKRTNSKKKLKLDKKNYNLNTILKNKFKKGQIIYKPSLNKYRDYNTTSAIISKIELINKITEERILNRCKKFRVCSEDDIDNLDKIDDEFEKLVLGMEGISKKKICGRFK